MVKVDATWNKPMFFFDDFVHIVSGHMLSYCTYIIYIYIDAVCIMKMNNETLKRWVKTYLQVLMLSFYVWKGPITFWIHETILQTIKVAAPLLVKYVIYLSWKSLTIPLHHEFLRVTSVEFTKSIFPQLTSSTPPMAEFIPTSGWKGRLCHCPAPRELVPWIHPRVRVFAGWFAAPHCGLLI